MSKRTLLGCLAAFTLTCSVSAKVTDQPLMVRPPQTQTQQPQQAQPSQPPEPVQTVTYNFVPAPATAKPLTTTPVTAPSAGQVRPLMVQVASSAPVRPKATAATAKKLAVTRRVKDSQAFKVVTGKSTTFGISPTTALVVRPQSVVFSK